MLRTGLLTDHYELTMLDSWVRDGSVHDSAVFEAFARRLPEGRRYGVLAGLGRLVPLIEAFTFDAEEVAWLRERGVIGESTAAYLRDFRFGGDVDAYREGDLYFPGSPVLTVSGTLGECVVLETLVLSVLNHDTAIASAATRMVDAAAGRPIIEMGGRRTHEQAAVATARAAYLAGFASTSNLAAGRCYGIPTVGTAAHAFTLAHESEEAAFRSQVEAQGVGTTLLVDTYDIAEGIRTAVRVAGPGLGAVRIDSGDLAEEAAKARELLDSLGAMSTRIVVTSDLDEFVMAALADAPIDGYGVGTRVATGSGHPTASMVYKLVEVAGRQVSKKSKDKVSVGGRKLAFREYDDHGLLARETFVAAGDLPPEGATPVQVPVMRGGRAVHAPGLEEVRRFTAGALATLPAEARTVAAGAPYLTVAAHPPPVAALIPTPSTRTREER
ncbi:MAG TPA: nicotinate phosphoribosyltransferase [Nocardioides sp.]|nr:nicotinate phosphoribosyltransferase [Nocardioides sp.]